MAWPMVWPKLSTARSPDSRSSRSTTPALYWIEPATSSCVTAPAVERRARELPHAAQHGAPGEQAVLGHLGGAAAQLARRQRLERAQVGEHQARLIEGADVVLAGAEVHGDLAAHGRVDLGEQRRRHLHEADAALVGGGDEPGEVADHAAAERDQRVAAAQPTVVEHAVELLGAGEVLLPLARRQDHLRGAQTGRHQAPRAPGRGTAARRSRRRARRSGPRRAACARRRPARRGRRGRPGSDTCATRRARSDASRGAAFGLVAVGRAAPSRTADREVGGDLSAPTATVTSTTCVATSRYSGSRAASKAPERRLVGGERPLPPGRRRRRAPTGRRPAR